MGDASNDRSYFDDMSSQLLDTLNSYKRVLIIGFLPPPLGGVSVHIYRLHKILKDSEVFDLSQVQQFKGENYIKLFKYIKNADFDAIHIHSYELKVLIILEFLKIFKKFEIISTSHNPRLFEINNVLKKFFYRRFLTKLDVLVVVGEHILKDYVQRNIQLPREIIVEPAFLPPPIDEEQNILNTYPKELSYFTEKSTPLLVANAFQISFYEGIDLYGLDMCVELTAKLKMDFPSIGFLFALANENIESQYFEKIKQRIIELNITENFYFLTGQKELWPLFKKSDLMVRPTNTDGDALSIREALYFGKKVVSSDVCNRPRETILFNNRDIEDLYLKIKEVLSERY